MEIRGVGSHNKGSEMMLLVILQELKSEKIKFTIAPQKDICEYSFYSRLGLYPKVWCTYKKIQLGRLGRYLPAKIRNLYGLVTEEEVNLILDASGFAYSSQWGQGPAANLAANARRWKLTGKNLLLLPQSFGPFNTKKIKRYMKIIIENSSLIYARDEFSYTALKEIKEDKKIKICPDFTLLLQGIKPPYFDALKHKVCVVPNQRMIDKSEQPLNYERFLVKVIKTCQSKNITPFFLIFGGKEDKNLASRINSLLENKVEIIDEENIFYIKGIIENSLLVVGSRYHSLAAGFYSGIPTFGTGWSHKYRYLFKEFGFEEGLVDIGKPETEIHRLFSLGLNETSRADLHQRFLKKTEERKVVVWEMFREVNQLIEKIYESLASCRR